jgi:CxxC motif-containing protein (DUF1111 family)
MTTRSNQTLLLAALLLACSGAFVFSADSNPARPDLDAKTWLRVESVTRPTKDFTKPEAYETMQAGAATSIEEPDRKAFSHFTANLDAGDEMNFRLGNALFRKLWVPAPSSTQASDGLGPFYNARSCEECHKEDGRGHPPEGKPDATSMFLRLARTANSDADKKALADHLGLNLPDPVYGKQLQDKATPGLIAEGQMAISYTEQPFTFPDGSAATLRKPTYEAVYLRYGPLAKHTTVSARVAPAMIGLGLIEAIADSDILVHADPEDRDADGISGQPQMLRDPKGEVHVGRFGWKAENFSIREQSAQALVGDIGISTPDLDFPQGDCTAAQVDCLARPNGDQARLGKSEAPDPILSLITFYSQNLAVPARRKASFDETLAGKKLFYESGCISCHQPKYVTRKDWPEKSLRFQLIWPYSDFLLHDMGEGLADGQQVGAATGKEWRTPPLWGIGLTKTVSGHTFFLHDGRARSLDEAILWHGGEAAKARDNYTALQKADRQKLISFLESL